MGRCCRSLSGALPQIPERRTGDSSDATGLLDDSVWFRESLKPSRGPIVTSRRCHVHSPYYFYNIMADGYCISRSVFWVNDRYFCLAFALRINQSLLGMYGYSTPRDGVVWHFSRDIDPTFYFPVVFLPDEDTLTNATFNGVHVPVFIIIIDAYLEKCCLRPLGLSAISSGLTPRLQYTSFPAPS